MEAFLTFMERFTRVPASEWTMIRAAFEEKTYRKGELILQEGKICRHLYFLESGLLRYFITKDGLEITKYFTDAPFCFTSQNSFTAQQPSRENIAVIEEAVIWQTTLTDANALLELKSWNNFIRLLIQQVQTYTEDILQDLQTKTAEERYLLMLEKNPGLTHRIPLHMLASYLGIAAPSLSRIRKKISTTGKT